MSGVSLAGDPKVVRALDDAIGDWKPGESVIKKVRKDGDDVMIHVDPLGKFSAQHVEDRDWGDAKKAAKKADKALKNVLDEVRKDLNDSSDGTTFHATKVDGQKFLITVRGDDVSVQEVRSWEAGKKIQEAVDELIAQMLAPPPDLRHTLKKKVKTKRDGHFQVTLGTDFQASVRMTKKPKRSFLARAMPFIKMAASFLCPPVALGLSAVQAVQSFAKGNILGGLVDLSGTIGAAVGGSTGALIQRAGKAVRDGEALVNAAANGGITGVIEAGAGIAGAVDPGLAKFANQVSTGAQVIDGTIGALKGGQPLAAVATLARGTGDLFPEAKRTTDKIAHGAQAVYGTVGALKGGQPLAAVATLARGAGDLFSGTKRTTDEVDVQEIGIVKGSASLDALTTATQGAGVFSLETQPTAGEIAPSRVKSGGLLDLRPIAEGLIHTR